MSAKVRAVVRTFERPKIVYRRRKTGKGKYLLTITHHIGALPAKIEITTGIGTVFDASPVLVRSMTDHTLVLSIPADVDRRAWPLRVKVYAP